jgi:hypothetical protein
LTKQPTVSSISSHIPLMMTSKNDENRPITQSITDTNAKPDVHTFLPTFPVNTSEKKNLLVMMKLHIYI